MITALRVVVRLAAQDFVSPNNLVLPEKAEDLRVFCSNYYGANWSLPWLPYYLEDPDPFTNRQGLLGMKQLLEEDKVIQPWDTILDQLLRDPTTGVWLSESEILKY